MSIIPNNGNNPFAELENPDLKLENEQKDSNYAKQVADATPEGTKQMQEEAGKVLGKDWDETSVFSQQKQIREMEKRDAELEVGLSPEEELEKQLNGNSIKNTVGFETELPEKKQLPSQSETQELTSETEQEQTLEVAVDYIEDSPFTPIIENLVKNHSLTQEQVQSFFEQAKGENMKTQQELFSKFINYNVADKKVVENVLRGFSEKTENITEENFSTTEFANQAGSFLDIPEQTTGLEYMLAEHYTPIPNAEGQQNIQQDIQTALQSTANTIITKNNNNFKKDYFSIIEKVRTATSIQEQYSALQDLHKADLLKDAHHLGIKSKADIREKEHDIKREYTEKTRALDTAKESRNTELEQRLHEEIQELIKDAQTLDKLGSDFHLIEGEFGKGEGDAGIGGGPLDAGSEATES